MKLETVEILSIASGGVNEDRAGVAPRLAWVIDGATDVVPEPLTAWPSDAAWFAAGMHDLAETLHPSPSFSLADLPELVAERLAARFAADAKRTPAGRDEHPSASAIVVRTIEGDTLEYVSVGDCTLIVDSGGHRTQVGVDEENAGDRWVVDALKERKESAKPMTRADLWPQLRAQRARMNTPTGYGVFSITAPPRSMIRHGTIPLAPESRILLASDGLMRLVDVFRRYTAARLFDAAWTTGLDPLFDELRALETADADCTRHPRAKTSDDTSAVLLRATVSP
ncbi:protein phosphatase 2C domain-containing protein [uncultured Hyphomicrobium sp.]|uniref:protein phosphatase 2C domain-containing protein n=1 Tax=uncultured Hyphomicrobium sp. TaxID=194373 RepID=UPI0025E03216|nr:protein phosphatase 2C domain-containing protein [uncultured Hyphomicrobium sp.]